MNDSFKVVLMGESSVGKTALAIRFSRKSFNEYNDATVGASFSRFEYNGINIRLWDTAGQERYLSLCQLYYRDADVILLVFDVYELNSLKRAEYYINKINSENKDDYFIVIVGNKMDLIKNETTLDLIKKKVQDELLDKFNNLQCIFVSAKTNENIENLLDIIKVHCNSIKKKYKKNLLLFDQNNNLYSRCEC